MAEDNLEILHFMDHRPNGRCRAWWMARDACPGHKNSYEYAIDNVEKFVARAAKLDAKNGLVSGCREPKLMEAIQRPIRRRTRVASG